MNQSSDLFTKAQKVIPGGVNSPVRAFRSVGGTPFFTKKELKYFYKKIEINESKLFFIKSKDTRHNIFGLWSVSLIEKLEADIMKGERKVEIWANSIGVKTVNIEYKKPDPFFNINTKEDLEKAVKEIQND